MRTRSAATPCAPEIDTCKTGYALGANPILWPAKVLTRPPTNPQSSVFQQPANGLIPRTMLGQQQFRAFFDEVRSAWKAALQQDGEPEHLRLLVERLNPGNYTFEQRGNEIVPVDFAWPEAIARQNEKDLQALAERQTISQLAWRCREFLDAGTALPADQLQWLWDFLQTIDAKPPELPSDSSGPLLRIEDVFCAGIAVLLATSRDWLLQDASRMAWCRRKLQATIDDPPPPRRFDSEVSVGNERWDSFAAECGVLLLAADRSDVLARKLVGAGLVAFNYNTTALHDGSCGGGSYSIGRCVRADGRFHDPVGGAAPTPGSARHSRPGSGARALCCPERRFASCLRQRKLSPVAAALGEINSEARAARDAMHEKQFLGSSARSQHHQKSAGRRKSREVLHPDQLGLDPTS